MATSLPESFLPAGPVADDGMAVPRDMDARYGAGIDLGICLGGGGIYFLAWQAAYLHALARRGINLARADRVVGTSAGSVVSTTLVRGRISRLHSEVSLLARFPALVAALAPAGTLRPSQLRALERFALATDAEPATVQAIGHAALAARTPTAATARRNVGLVVGAAPWKTDVLHLTGADAMTGERCVMTRATSVSFARAAAASSAVPGIFPPQPVGDRFLMDGGVAGSGLHHLDLLAGAKRVLVLAVTDGHGLDEAGMTTTPQTIAAEIAALQATGAEVLVRTPESVDFELLMDPAQAPQALAMGAGQGAADAGAVGALVGRGSPTRIEPRRVASTAAARLG